MTKAQLYVLLLGAIHRHNLNKAIVTDILVILNLVAPGCLPRNLYYFNREGLSDSQVQDMHIVCDSCGSYICKYSEDRSLDICSACKSEKLCKDLVKENSYFMTSSLATQLKCILESKIVNESDISHSNSCDVIGDVVHGYEYQRRKINFPDSISLTCNIDGAQVFESSNLSLWPVYYTVNELQPAIRRKNLICHGLWCGHDKPCMDVYLKPIIDELCILSEKGVMWKRDMVNQVTKVYLVLVTCDSVARPVLQTLSNLRESLAVHFAFILAMLLVKVEDLFVHTVCKVTLPFVVEITNKLCSMLNQRVN